MGTDKGADKMMKYDAVGTLLLKVMGGISLLISSVAALIYAVGRL